MILPQKMNNCKVHKAIIVQVSFNKQYVHDATCDMEVTVSFELMVYTSTGADRNWSSRSMLLV